MARGKGVGTGIAVGLAAGVLAWALWAVIVGVSSWVIMLLLGVIHSGLPAVPALGYWVTFAVVGVISILASFFKSASSKR